MLEPKPIAVLADDEAQYTLAYGMFLEDLGYEVVRAESKQELLSKAAGASVLIVDACLPSVDRMEGIEAVAELLDDHPGGARLPGNVPIIFISGYREDTPLVRAKLHSYPVFAKRSYRWVWKDDEFEVLSDAIDAERKRLNG
jgi:CheY-like chemotaxis protein